MRQVALITGASRGIGLATALALAREGFAVAVNGLADDAELAGAVEHVRALGADAVGLPFDVSDLTAHAPALRHAEAALGPLTTLVNNAGVGVISRGDPLDVTEASYDRCLSVNAKAMFFLMQAFARLVIARGPDRPAFHSIVNVTSSNATAVAEPRSEYAVSKAAAAMASRAFAVRLGRDRRLRRAARPDRHRDDGGSDRQLPRPCRGGADADAAHRYARGNGHHHRHPCDRAASLHHGPGHFRRWRVAGPPFLKAL
jgi:NAD(P)-dependent dehydrogenase (short-subunit alcohol dehydrogenase family)